MKSPLLFLLLFFALDANAQKEAKSDDKQANLIPNSGFEMYGAAPLGWFYRWEHFNSAIKYWTSPTGTSPDVYSPKIKAPDTWAEKGFGKLKPHSGNAMLGITVYGCENGKPHCREYAQIQLIEPLVIGQTYLLEFYYNHLPRSLRVNNIGGYFSKKKINTKIEDPLVFAPQAYDTEIMAAGNGWKKFSKKFKAKEELDYLILGNFFTDKLTAIKPSGKADGLNFAYYYIDDVVLKKMLPIVPIPVPDDDLTKVKIEKGKTIVLKNIYFESADFELEPRSFVELKKLLFLMRQNPTMSIEIQGHTDNEGTHDYNMKLSQGRAESVTNFLVYNGIKSYRMKSKGFGETQALTENETEEGKQKNRRVAFAILSQ